MIRSFRDLTSYAFRARDGDIGRVHDILFDDVSWTVRYFALDTGRWIPGKVVLMRPEAIESVDWNERTIQLGVTKEQVEKSPSVMDDEPVSRQKEEQIHHYFGWQRYWLAAPTAIDATGDIAPTPDKAGESEERTPDSKSDPNLRSLREVTGYSIRCQDGDAGVVHDFAGDDESWIVRYIVVDTHRWLPGRKLLLALEWVSGIDWDEQRVHVDVPKQKLQESPEFDPDAPINRRYEERLYDFYGRPRYWSPTDEETTS